MLLEIANLKKSYPEPSGRRIPILDIPKFELAQGEQVVLRGESGGGKTTLLHIISGLVEADGGSVRLEGVELIGFSESRRDRIRAAKMGYVFQTFNLLPAFTALENVRLAMTFAGRAVDVARAKELLARVGLENRMHYLPSQLSVGQQQRVSVARALANRPKLLLADEPTANVDPANQSRIIELIQSTCRAENVALLLVTHSDDVASRFTRVEQLGELNRAAQQPVVEDAV
ncbi:MAG: ABC transporter ATP-binding protein [Planctomycetes bacterium]|jgi:putative ABC transport system ATP-binding protein|nr:ABC transporter ATP-binding protein [Planctomycetota bacterium]